ncbi:MAG TPA: DTW domain-containing protein, partial [Polyangia bacterium]|nr:DTW domain-containing protein [Polyangia bacterium]
MSRRAKPHLRCATCRMHRSLCICALLPRLATRTRVLLLLHQLEARKPTNTGIVAARCLGNSAVVYRGRAPEGAPGATLEAALATDLEPVLLFPHPSAAPLER